MKNIFIFLFFSLLMVGCNLSTPLSESSSKESTPLIIEGSVNSETPSISTDQANNTNLDTDTSKSQIIYSTGELGDKTLWISDVSGRKNTKIITGYDISYFVNPYSNLVNLWVAQDATGTGSGYILQENETIPVEVVTGVTSSWIWKSENENILYAVIELPNNIEQYVKINQDKGEQSVIAESSKNSIQTYFAYDNSRYVLYSITQGNTISLYLQDTSILGDPYKLEEGTYINLVNTFKSFDQTMDYIVWVQDYRTIKSYNIDTQEEKVLLQADWIRDQCISESQCYFFVKKGDQYETYEINNSTGELLNTSFNFRIDSFLNNRFFIIDDSNINQSILRNVDNTINLPIQSEDMEIVWPKLIQHDKLLIYLGMNSEQTNWSLFLLNLQNNEYQKITEYYAPNGSASPNKGISTVGDYGILHSGYFIETSNDTAKGGYFVSSDENQIVSCWSILKGDKAGTYRLIYVNLENGDSTTLAEGEGSIEFFPRFSPDGKSIFVIIKDKNNKEDLMLYRVNETPLKMVSEADEIFFDFSSEGNFIIVYESTNNTPGKIHIVNLSNMASPLVIEGNYPYITNTFSIDGRPWE